MLDPNPKITLDLPLNDVNSLIAIIEGFLEHAPKRSLEETHYAAGLGLRIRNMALESLNAPKSEEAVLEPEKVSTTKE